MTARDTAPDRGGRGDFRRGFLAMLPLWLGLIPFAAAYAVSARSAGLTLLETQLMSLIVFSGGAQFSAAGLFAVQAPGPAVILTTFLINLRHLLYGLSLGQRVRMTQLQRLLGAHVLTDEAYGVTVARGERSFGFFVGSALSLFLIWNLSTLLGGLLSRLVPDPAALGVDFVFPLAFLALLIPLLSGFKALGVALAAGALALVTARTVGTGVAILLAGVVGALLGAWWTRGDEAAEGVETAPPPSRNREVEPS